jgi:uncharacterized cupin superfamily protein
MQQPGDAVAQSAAGAPGNAHEFERAKSVVRCLCGVAKAQRDECAEPEYELEIVAEEPVNQPYLIWW